jgi:hypothetical protein
MNTPDPFNPQCPEMIFPIENTGRYRHIGMPPRMMMRMMMRNGSMIAAGEFGRVLNSRQCGSDALTLVPCRAPWGSFASRSKAVREDSLIYWKNSSLFMFLVFSYSESRIFRTSSTELICSIGRDLPFYVESDHWCGEGQQVKLRIFKK